MKLPLSSILSLTTLTTALPFGPKLSADSKYIFTDRNLQYPTVRDALLSLCRNVADLQRSYEMDQHYRTRELDHLVQGNLDAACCESAALGQLAFGADD
jgi:hypothetical protein